MIRFIYQLEVTFLKEVIGDKGIVPAVTSSS